jgi:benzoate-CoA ligase
MNLAQHVLGNRYPGRIALVCGDEQVTREELAVRVARAAGALRTLGVKPREPVLFVMRDTPDFAAAWLGAVQAGAVAVALNGELGEADYRYILTDSRARFAVVEPSFAVAREVFRDIRVSLARSEPVAPFEAQPEAPAFCLYSSGTTGSRSS